MTLRRLVVLLAVGLALAVLGWLLRMTLDADAGVERHQSRLERLTAVAGLQTELSTEIERLRVEPLLGQARLVDTGKRLLAAQKSLDSGAATLAGLSPLVDRNLADFRAAARDQIGALKPFQTAVATYARALAELERATQASGRAADTGLLQAVRGYSGGDSANGPQIAKLLALLNTEARDAAGAQRARLGAVATAAIAALSARDQIALRAAEIPTADGSLAALRASYEGRYRRLLAQSERYRLILVVYAVALLGAFGVVGLRLRQSFGELDSVNAQLQQANAGLEKQVENRTRALSKALDDLRLQQAHLIQSEKMASLGQMVAGVAHEINTPLGYARSNVGVVRESIASLTELLSGYDRAFARLSKDGIAAEERAACIAQIEALRNTWNPDEGVVEFDVLLTDADHGLIQIADLVGSLKDFSRVDRSRTELFDVNDGLEAALKICHNQLKTRITVERDFGVLKPILCAPSQLNQIFVNIINNASQAIEGEGEISVSTRELGDGVEIAIRDSGCGMDEQTRAHIFEPFFTTKAVGQGTGLGLSIVFRIIEDHGGRIEVDSAPGRGTEFRITLPRRVSLASANSLDEAA